MSSGRDPLHDTVERLAGGLFRYCLAHLRSREAAEEVAQETLAALVSRWRRLGPPEEPAAWTFGVARRRCARRRVAESLRRPLDGLFVKPDPDPGPEARARDRSELARVLDALRGLGRRDRQAILLVVAGGLGRTEAARQLGISESALKMRLHRARHRLAERLKKEELDDRRRMELLVAERTDP